ncbi:MAG: helix-turn-helix transcriptional regulator [Alcanivoracaceae bacterium]|nr:helix-turn-helix transcriptional regulator [Alcanivoracaceae bacterium]
MDRKQLVGARVKALRKTRGLSQRSLAEILGKSTESVSQLERGVFLPSYETLEGLAVAFDVPMAEFFPSVGGSRLTDKEEDLINQVQQISRRLGEKKLETAVAQLTALLALSE